MYVREHRKPLQYTATAQLLFGGNQQVQALLGLSASVSATQETSVAATNAALVSLPVIAARTQRALGSAAPPSGVFVTDATSGLTNLLTLSATYNSPTVAARVVNAYARQYVIYTEQSQSQTINATIAELSRQVRRLQSVPGASATAAGLQTTLVDFEGIKAANPVDVSVAQRAGPGEESGPHASRDAVLGALVGAAVGFLLLLIVSIFDPKLRSLNAIDGPVGFLTVPARLNGRHRIRRSVKDGHTMRTALVAAGPPSTDDQGRLLVLTSSSDPVDMRATQYLGMQLLDDTQRLNPHASVVVLDLTGRLRGSDALPDSQIRELDAATHLTFAADFTQAVRIDGRESIGDGDTDLVLASAGSDPWRFDELYTRTVVDRLRARYKYVLVHVPPVSEIGSLAWTLVDAEVVVSAALIGKSSTVSAQKFILEISAVRNDRVLLFGAT